LKALYFQTGFSQEHRGRYDINESNLMQHKEQQKSNSIFIKKNIFCLSVRQLNSEIRVLSIKSGNLTLNEKQRWLVYCVFYTTQCYRHGMCFRASILFWFPQCTHYFWRVFRFLFMEHKHDYSV